MGTSSNLSRQKTQENRNPIEHAFAKVFRRIKKILELKSVTVDELADYMLDALIQAATSKCIEFNIEANRTGKRGEASFILMSNLRGICEDLIYLTYLSRMEKENTKRFIKLLFSRNISEGLNVQKQFFDCNNPTQPVLGASSQSDVSGSKEIREFWKSTGQFNKKIPSVRDLAKDVGLKSTYDFIYFAASNFVHFNPSTLFRTGWGSDKGPFTFSIRNMNEYYRSFSSFYGAVLFIGFQASFSEKYFNVSLDTEANRLIELIGHVQRWPEIITFEEMNEKPPLYILTHAMGKIMVEEDKTIPYGAILQEVQSLGGK